MNRSVLSMAAVVLAALVLLGFSLRDRHRFGTSRTLELAGTLAVSGLIAALRMRAADGALWALAAAGALGMLAMVGLTHGHPLWLTDHVSPLDLTAAERRILKRAQWALLVLVTVLGFAAAAVA